MFDISENQSSNFEYNMVNQPFCYGKILQNYDKDHPNQVKVQLSALYETGKNEVWANLSVPYGGEAYGMHFLPEVGELVLLAMISAESPVVISSVLGKQGVPKTCIDNSENEKKTIRTKAGNEIYIQDTKDKAVIQMKTVGGYMLEISEETKKITVTDKNKKNSLEIDAEGGAVTVKADKKLVLSVGGKDVIKLESSGASIVSSAVKIEGSQKIEQKAGQLSISGSTAEIKADANLTVKSGGVAQIKGSMLKLN